MIHICQLEKNENNMKKSILALIVAAPLTLSLTGCVVAVGGDDRDYKVSGSNHNEFENRKSIASLPLSTSYNDAVHKLGVAEFNEKYEQDGDLIQVIYYRTHRVHKDGLTTKDECTYLKFVNGALVATGDGGDIKPIS